MTGRPKKALVLAAGLGTRLRPLTLERPKPLLPLWNVPLLERVLRLLEGWGVEEVVVNLHWQPEKIQAYLDRRVGPACIRVSAEPDLLGTGGALRPLQDFLGEEPFWIINADIAAEVEPAPFLQAFASGDGLAAAWLEPKKGPRTVEVDRRGRITSYRSPTPGVPGTFTFCGLQLVSPRIFSYLPARPFCTLVEAYEQAMGLGVFVGGVSVPGSYWDDAGTVGAYLRIHKELRKSVTDDASDTPSRHFFCIGEHAVVAPDVRGKDSVVYGTARVDSGSVLKDCVIAGGCVGGKLDGVVCVGAADAGDEALPEAVMALGWDPEKVAAAFLGVRGSNRSFWRLYQGGQSAIYIRYSLERPENARYSSHARALSAAGVPVPAVLADLPASRCLVLEDWGNDSLQKRMAAHPERAATWYGPVLEALARFHREGTRQVSDNGVSLEPRFDAALYAWEHQLFEEHLLKNRYGFDAFPEEVARELRAVAERLQGARQVVLHRDFQSSNILFRGKEFAFIDFQGMRLGAAAYDLASLLYDPYVKIKPVLRARLVAEYGQYQPEIPDACDLFFEGAVQRLVQALGAFGRLASVGQTGFICHILSALENLLEASDTCGLEALGGLTEELIAREQSRCGS